MINFANVSLGNLKEGDWKIIDINKIKRSNENIKY